MQLSPVLKSLVKGTLGLILLLPASYFAFALTVRIFFGATHLYYGIAASFLESNPGVFSFDMAAWILYGPALCLLLNFPGITGWDTLFSLGRSGEGFRRPHWFNTAISLQATLLFFLASAWFFIQHYRYH